MNSLKEIVESYRAIKLAEERAVLATVVKARGALQQCSGSRMIVREDGTTVGTMGNEELQALVADRAVKDFDSGDAHTVSFAVTASITNADAREPVPQSVAHILLEPLRMSGRSAHLRFIADCPRLGKSGVVATIFRVEGEFKARIGTHAFLKGDGKIEEDIRNPVLVAAITKDCIRALRSKSSFAAEYRFTEGIVEAFIEFIAGL